MRGLIETRLEALRADYEGATGAPFEHFFCPLLLEDTHVELCRAHLLNQALEGSSTKWTVQRADVDNFFGAFFESSFIELDRRTPIDDYLNGRSSSGVRPQLYLKTQKIDYYLPRSSVPSKYSEVLLRGKAKPIRLAIKLDPNEILQTRERDWQFVCEKDCRLEALVSLLKAAHLTLFEMLGYNYALSAGGLFLGHTILGKFFKENRGRPKDDVLNRAQEHFSQYANLVRPILIHPDTVEDTISGRVVYICEEPTGWAIITLLRTAKSMHAVLVPMLESTQAAARFVRFLTEDGSTLKARITHFDGDAFQASPASQDLIWPAGNFQA